MSKCDGLHFAVWGNGPLSSRVSEGQLLSLQYQPLSLQGSSWEILYNMPPKHFFLTESTSCTSRSINTDAGVTCKILLR